MVCNPRKSICAFCDKTFIQVHPATKHCSDKCYIKSNVDVNATTGCWNWIGALTIGGYGKSKGSSQAHRLSYAAFSGSITDGLFVCHKCDNKICCNPKHLFLGTHSDNMQDMLAKGRAKTTGRDHHDNKLTPKQVLAIREDKRLLKDIAEQYGVSTATISDIQLRKKWKQLKPDVNFERTHGKSRLTVTQLQAIIVDPRTQKVIAEEYGIKQAYVSRIKSGQAWKELLEDIPCQTQENGVH